MYKTRPMRIFLRTAAAIAFAVLVGGATISESIALTCVNGECK